MSKKELKISQLKAPKIALDIFKKFAGNGKAIDKDAEKNALSAVQKSLDAYGSNIFAIRVNMPSGDIVWSNNMASVLGRKDVVRYDQFEFAFHPDYVDAYNFWSTCLFEQIAVRQLDFEGIVFHIRVPFKNQETNKVYWYNQSSIALIADSAGDVLSFLSIYTFDCEWFENNPIIMIPSISFKNKQSPLDIELKMSGGVKILNNEFTEMERNILGCYIDNIKPSERFKTMSQNTINGHNVNIIKRAKSIFKFEFTKASAVAQFMKANHLWAI